MATLQKTTLDDLGSFILAVSLFAFCWLNLIADYVGFAVTLADATNVRAELWVGLLFLIGFYFVRFKSLSFTVVSAFVVGVVNITLILILSLLAFGHVQPVIYFM